MYTWIRAGLERGLKETFTQPAYILLQALWASVIAIIFYHVWSGVVTDPQAVLVHIAVGEAFWMSAGTGVSKVMEREYHEGRIDSRILRPVPLWVQYLTESAGIGFLRFLGVFLGISTVLFVYLGVMPNILLALAAYPMYALANTFIYFVLGSFVVDIGRVDVLRWVVSKLDVLFVLIPREVVGDLPYLLLPNAYAYYWPARFAATGSLPTFWIVGLLVLFFLALVSERRFIRKIEVFGG